MTLNWINRYNVFAAQVGTIGEIICAWNPGYLRDDPRPTGYHVSFCGTKLKAIFPDLEGAKAAGIRLAERKLRGALAEVTQ